MTKILYYHGFRNTYMSNWKYQNFIDELGHHNVVFDIISPLDYKDALDANRAIIEQISEMDYDLFMTGSNEKLIFPETLTAIKQKGIPTLLICFDNSLIPYFHKNICKYFSLVWLMEDSNENLFKKWGANYIFMPYAANPYFYKTNTKNEINRVVFLGTPYGSRANTINKLISNSIPVDLFGAKQTGTKHVYSDGFLRSFITDLKFPNGRKILKAAFLQRIKKESKIDYNSKCISHLGYAENISEIYSSYCLSLASTTARNTGILRNPINVIDLRSFEIPMCGGIQFCRFNPELAKYFEDGKEIVFYHSEKDMIEKAAYYLSDEAKTEREQIRNAARKRAELDHTWWNRFKRIFDTLNIQY